ncbi:MAG: outer membrane protein assembly factor BamA [Bdellovibrio sp.]|nr:outer membrane protein assembly factor BamA [Bdellovibrio sp.]
MLASLFLPCFITGETRAEVEATSEDTSSRHEGGLYGRKITSVLVEGLKRIEKDAVVAKMSQQVGSTLSAEVVRSDIQALYKMGFFEDISFNGQSDGHGGVIVTVGLRERPVVAKVEFEGNDHISSSDLREVIKVKDWSIFDVNKVKEDVGLIQKHYEEKGYYLAKVSFEVKEGDTGEVDLIYKVNDYEKVQIKKITFLNNKNFSDEQLKATFADTKEGGFLSFLTSSGNFKDTAFKQDLQRLMLWYLDHGYVKFRHENPVITVSDDKKWLYISVYVDEGPQYRIGNLDFGGDLLFPHSELADTVGMGVDDVFSITKRNQDIQKLSEKYQDLGYAFVNVIPKMEFHEDTKTLDLKYDFEKGNLVYFGEINVLGNAKTHDKVIRRELKVREGELFNGTRLRQSRENVERLGYFAPGEVQFNTISPKNKPDVVNLEISVKERSTGTVTLGAGFGSIQGFFFTTQISEINLFGRGQTLSLAGQYSLYSVIPGTTNSSLNLGFTDPYTFDTLWTTGFDIYAIYFPIPNKYNVKKLGFDFRLGHPIAEFTNLYLTYRFEGIQDLQVNGNIPADVFQKIANADNGILSSIALNVVRDKRNNRFETTGGNYQSLSLEVAGVGGDLKFVKWTANNRYYHKLLGDLVFRNNVEVGHIMGYGGLDVPPAQKFYLGGPNNMKGYQMFLLGPTTPDLQGNPFPLGGIFQAFTTVELEYPIIREAGIKFVVFFDAGNAWSRFPLDDIIRMDAGFGFRWFSPFGPLRFEFGYPLNPRAFDTSPVFQFMIGPPF